MNPVIDALRPAATRVQQGWSALAGDEDTPLPVRAAGRAVQLAVVYVLFVEIAVQLVLGRIDIPFLDIAIFELGRYDRALPRELMLNGAVIGSLYGLLAIGLILVYRANRIINFAQAQLGAVPASAALFLISFRDWPYFVALPLALVGGVLLGGVVEVLFIRRFSRAPRLILTVVTIGVGLLLQVMEFFTKEAVSEGKILDSLSAKVPTPFDDVTWVMGNKVFTGDHLVTIVIVAAAALGLGAFFRFTDIGIAVRASAENADRASLLGIPVKRVSTIVWILAALLSAIGVFLRAPLIGLSVTGFVGPNLLLYGLAAAVIARMDSMPRAILAGMGIGVIEQASVFATRRASLVSPIVLVIIVVALLVQRGTLSRAFDTGVSTWQAARDVRPIPAELRDHPAVRRARLVVWTVIAAFVALTPWIVGSSQTRLATDMVLLAMVGVSMVVLTGWTGQISLGQFAFAGIGSAVAGGLAANHGTDFFVTLVAAGLAGALVAVVIGLPALRIQGLFLAVTTLAFVFVVPDFILRREWFGWLLPEQSTFAERPVMYGAFDFSRSSEVAGVTFTSDAKYFYLCVAFLGLVLLVARSLRRYRSGRILIGIRDNSRMMQSYGVNLARTRLTAFAIAGFIAAMAGALITYQRGSVSPDGFLADTSISVFLMTVIGGISSLPGAVLGAVFVKGIPLLPVLRDVELIELLTSGLGVLVLLQVLPGGLIEGVLNVRDSWLRRLAEREGIHVPSLLADSLVDADEVRSQDAAATQAAAHADEAPPPLGPDELLCPVCGERVRLADARRHDHLAPTELIGVER